MMTRTLLPMMYASSRATTKETDPPTTGVKVMAEVAVLNRSAKPVGPVVPVVPVVPVAPVGPSMPSKFTLYTAADPKDPLTFVMPLTVIAPVEKS